MLQHAWLRPRGSRQIDIPVKVATLLKSVRSTDPIKDTIQLIADFLLHLTDEKKFTLNTIIGYRLAITLALKTENVDVINTHQLATLLNAMTMDIPHNMSSSWP